MISRFFMAPLGLALLVAFGMPAQADTVLTLTQSTFTPDHRVGVTQRGN